MFSSEEQFPLDTVVVNVVVLSAVYITEELSERSKEFAGDHE